MGGPIEDASRRHVARLMRRIGIDAATAPDREAWEAFLAAVQSLLSDLEQDRYLLERSLDTSSEEMRGLNEELQASTALLALEREELRSANSLLKATLESTADGIMVADGDGAVTMLNARMAAMWGLSEELIAADDGVALFEAIMGKLRDRTVLEDWISELRQHPGASSHYTVELLDGRTIECDSVPQLIEGNLTGRVWSTRDVTEQHRLQHELSEQAFHDPLTHLANRALLAQQLDQALRRSARTGTHVAVVVVDLDGFKLVNDSFGHGAGDALLVELADRFRRTLRDFDTIARFGGDEFAMVVDGLARPEDAGRIGQRILDTLAEPFVVHGRSFVIGASVGLAVADDHTESADTLVANADAAMYWGKRDGKNCFRIFESSLHVTTLERLDVEQALREAVTHDGLSIHFQPVVAATTGQVVSFEALARWFSRERGPVPPDVFIPVAEEIGLIHDIGRWVLIEACRQLRAWRDEFPEIELTIAVNVSRLQLIDPAFHDDVLSALAAAGLHPSSLNLEITETMLGTDLSAIVAVLQRLRRAGVRVAIDDFGTGYSSLATLAELPVDALKIDKRFIDGLTTSERGVALVEAIVQLGRTLGLCTVAEGVEDPDQRHLLAAVGCDHIQGYLFSRPLSAEDARSFLVHEAGLMARSLPA